jgi:hypothetical protein
VLQALRIEIEPARAQVSQIVEPGTEVTSGQIPFTPPAKKVLELALREALSLGHNYIGTEHILLGLVREDDGVAAHVLHELGADSEPIRHEVIRMLSGPGSREWAPTDQPLSPRSSTMIASAWLDGLGPRLLDQLDADIRGALKRSPDLGDLLLVLTSARGTLAGDAAAALGVELDVLWGTIERLRAERERTSEELLHQMETLRQARQKAIAAEEFAEAAALRDQERELAKGLVPGPTPPDALDEIRRRLGIP